MIQEIFARCDVINLEKLFDYYGEINDVDKMFGVGGRILQSEDSNLLDKNLLVKIFDTLYKVIDNKRKTCDKLKEIEILEGKNKSRTHLSYLHQYKAKLYGDLGQLLQKMIVDIKKGIKNNEGGKNKEVEMFLTLCLCDYQRYLCETTVEEDVKQKYIKETEESYLALFKLYEEYNTCEVSPAYITAHYHYAIFQFDVKREYKDAINYLKKIRFDIIGLLDTMFKNFLESYDLLDVITSTLTNWVIITNYKDEDI